MADPVFTPNQLWWLAIVVSNGKGNTRLAAAVAGAESSGRPGAFLVNSDSFRSVDRGLWQLNSHWHAEVSDTCAYTPLCNARNAERISNGWTDFSQWSTFHNGAYLNHFPAGPLPVPIPDDQLRRLYRPSNAPVVPPLTPGTNPFTGTVGIVPPAPAPSQDHSAKTKHTGQRAGVHGSSVNDAANAIHRLPVGRSSY